MYQYKASVVNVVDGDTIDLDIDLGFRITIRQRCRLRGVNCPEKRGATKSAGDLATEFTKEWLTDAGAYGQVEIRSSKPYADDKYGRFLVEVSSPIHSSTLNEALIASKNAVPYMVND